MTEATLLTFSPRKRAVTVPRYYVVRLSGDFTGMSRWLTREQAEIAAEEMAEQYPGDEIAVLAPVALRRSTASGN
jgi:hypothetical protein